jgi:hypothetical protein
MREPADGRRPVSRQSENPEEEREHSEEFGELLKYTLVGFAGGLGLGGALDHLGLQRSGLGQWAVRTLSGEGESLFEGVYALRRRLARSSRSMAEAYGWGKLLGMAAPWVVDGISRRLGVNVYGVEGFYIPYFYALSDHIGANVSGLVFLRRQRGSWRSAVGAYVRHPVMLASLLVVLVVPVALAAARGLGFRPTTQLLTAAETMAANLCWLPPLVGWLGERRARLRGRPPRPDRGTSGEP